jgi:hypothetical protein
MEIKQVCLHHHLRCGYFCYDWDITDKTYNSYKLFSDHRCNEDVEVSINADNRVFFSCPKHLMKISEKIKHTYFNKA